MIEIKILQTYAVKQAIADLSKLLAKNYVYDSDDNLWDYRKVFEIDGFYIRVVHSVAVGSKALESDIEITSSFAPNYPSHSMFKINDIYKDKNLALVTSGIKKLQSSIKKITPGYSDRTTPTTISRYYTFNLADSDSYPPSVSNVINKYIKNVRDKFDTHISLHTLAPKIPRRSKKI